MSDAMVQDKHSALTREEAARAAARQEQQASAFRDSEGLAFDLDAQAWIVDLILEQTLAGDDYRCAIARERMSLDEGMEVHIIPTTYPNALRYAVRHLVDLAGQMRRVHEETFADPAPAAGAKRQGDGVA